MKSSKPCLNRSNLGQLFVFLKVFINQIIILPFCKFQENLLQCRLTETVLLYTNFRFTFIKNIIFYQVVHINMIMHGPSCPIDKLLMHKKTHLITRNLAKTICFSLQITSLTSNIVSAT